MRQSHRFAYLLLPLLAFAASPSAAEAPGIELVERLASPEFEGRGVGTAGLERARDYLETALREAGMAPAFPGREGAPASYRQELRVFVGNEILPGNELAGQGAPAFIPLAFSKSGRLEGAGVVFAGFGITVRGGGALVYDDYEGLDVHGKIVVAMLGDPGTGNRDSLFRNPALYAYSTPMYKVQNAELHGAAGIVLVRDPLSLSGAEAPLRFQPRQGGGATTEILAGQASVALTEQLLGRDLRALQEEIARTQRPASFALDARVALGVNLRRQLGAVENVAALIPGTDPALAREVVVVGAHYDHLGYGGDSSLDPDGLGKVHFGADDNASGVQAAFDLARAVQRRGGGRRPLLVVFFTAEEIGLLGSQHFVDNLPLPEGSKVVAMLNLDMVGRLHDDKLSVLAANSAHEFPAMIARANEAFGFQLLTGDNGFGSSDHASFLRAKVPSLFFTTGAHGDYHRPTDQVERINVPGLQRVREFAFALWESIDALVAPPTYDPASESPDQPPRDGKGYGAYFGSIPEFEQAETQGVLLQGVRPGSPAEQVGLRGGDVLTGLGEIKVRNLQDLVFALRYYRPNEEVGVTWVRGGVPMDGRVKLRERTGSR